MIQGCSIASGIYDIAISPSVKELSEEKVKQVWIANDAAAAWEVKDLMKWYENVVRIGPKYRYMVNAAKSWLILNPNQKQEPFQNTYVQITYQGATDLGGGIGTQ